MSRMDPKLKERLEKLVSSMGYELVGGELSQQGRQTLFRLFIDSPTGVSIDDCSKVSHQVSAMLDVDDPIDRRYVLEVSSPGIDRPLFEIEQYRRFIGKQVRLRLQSPIQQRRQLRGVLVRVESDDIYLRVEDLEDEVKVPFSAIEKANLVGEVNL